MKKSEIVIGKTYLMKHTSGLIPVIIERVRKVQKRPGYRTTTHWLAINRKTGREITVKSAMRLKKELTEDDVDKMLGRKSAQSPSITPAASIPPPKPKGWY